MSEIGDTTTSGTGQSAVGPRELDHIRVAIHNCFGGMGGTSVIWSNQHWNKGYSAGVLAALTAFDHAVKYLGERPDSAPLPPEDVSPNKKE